MRCERSKSTAALAAQRFSNEIACAAHAPPRKRQACRPPPSPDRQRCPAPRASARVDYGVTRKMTLSDVSRAPLVAENCTEVLARRQARERDVDLIDVGDRRGLDVERPHLAADPVQQPGGDPRLSVGGVRTDAHPEPLRAAEDARGDRHGGRVAPKQAVFARGPRPEHLRRPNHDRPRERPHDDVPHVRVDHPRRRIFNRHLDAKPSRRH